MSKRKRLAAIVLVALVLLGLMVSFAPRYIARHLVASQLDELGIEYQGVDTLNINPWTREVWLGPVRLGSGSDDPAQLGELGLSFRLKPLVNRRVSFDRVLLRGVDIVVTRGQDGEVALNGIPLSRFISPPEAQVEVAVEAPAWGAGAEVIELRDSRLIFVDRRRGDLEVEVERLTLREFETWKPDRPGLFELVAKVNDVQLNWSGEARPFADNVTLSIDSRTQDASLPKIMRFTGPWGLDRREGSYDAALKYEMTLFDSGRIEGHTQGSLGIEAVDYQRSGDFELKLERADLELDVRYSLSESGDFAMQGQVAADLGPTGGGLGEDTRFGATAGRLVASDIDAMREAGGALRLTLQPDFDLRSPEYSGPIQISVDSLLELLVLLQSLSAATVVAEAQTGLGDFADASVEVPPLDITAAHLTASGKALSLESRDGQANLLLQLGLDLGDVKVEVGDQKMGVERFSTQLERFDLTSGQGRIAIGLAGSKSLSNFSGAGSRGEMTLAAFDSEVGEFGMQAQTGAVSLQLAAKSRSSGFSGLVYATDERPEAQVELAEANARLGKASLDAKDGGLRWAVAGDAAVDSFNIEFAKSEEGRLKFARAEGSGFQANERLQIAADALTVDGLHLYLKRSLLEGLMAADGAAADDGAAPKAAPADESVAESVSEAPAEALDLRRLQTLLDGLGYEPGPADGQMGQKTARAISEFQRSEGLPVDGRPTAELLAAVEARAEDPTGSVRAPVERSEVSGASGLALRVGRLALTGKPVLRFRDDLVTPQVNVDSVFKEMEVRNLDIGNAGGRTELSWIADVNEFTHLEIKGWVTGLGETADLEVDAKLDNLELATYSPYVAELAGVYLDSGQLDAVASAKAEQGVLQGEIQLELDDLAFQPLSPEDAERLSGTVGVPLETAVNLLQDSEGRIKLKLPVSGPVNQPEVDVSSAVNKAIGGALKKVFPPTMVASMLSGVAKGAGPSFAPIEFAPGSAELSDSGKQFADGVVKLLSERPKLSLKACGRSTAQDLEQLTAGADSAAEAGEKRSAKTDAERGKDLEQVKQTMAELAVERQQVVRRYLIQERGADAKRLPECRSTFDDSDAGPPRVEISL